MKKLTEYQKEFILNNFFKNEEYAGWKNIATELLETGSCTVAGKDCIWLGGIGNFIKTDTDENVFGCLLYHFDLDVFLSSEWYIEVCTDYFSIIQDKKEQLEQECKEIGEILNQVKTT